MKDQIYKRIADFWKGHLSKEEQSHLLRDIKTHEEEIKSDLVDDFLKNKTNDGSLPERKYQVLLEKIHASMDLPNKKIKRLRWLKNSLSAAAVLLVIGLGGYFINTESNHSPHPIVSDSGITDTLRIYNNNYQDQQTVLADGSVVLLSPGSAITYTSNYPSIDRQLHLTGKGRFKVAHNISRPFIVWANGYSTTALGTDFSIDSRESGQLNIYLETGKIVVNAGSKAHKPMKSQYLLAGDQLRIITETGQISLTKPMEKIEQHRKSVVAAKTTRPVTPMMVFKDTPLHTVFQTIALEQGIQIITDAHELKGLTFTGEFKINEPAHLIIDIVCNMNGLESIASEQGIITVQKKVVSTE